MKLKKVLAGAVAAAMALTTVVTTSFTASAAGLKSVPSGTETVLQSFDLSGTQVSYSTAWENGDNVGITVSDTSWFSDSSVYIKVLLTSVGMISDNPIENVVTWDGYESWATVLNYYNNYDENQFKAEFIPTVDSTTDNCECYCPISDVALNYENYLGGNLQTAQAAGLIISAIEIVKFSTTTGGDDDTTGGNDDTTGGNDDTTGGDDDTTGGNDDTTGGDDDTTIDGGTADDNTNTGLIYISEARPASPIIPANSVEKFEITDPATGKSISTSVNRLAKALSQITDGSDIEFSTGDFGMILRKNVIQEIVDNDLTITIKTSKATFIIDAENLAKVKTINIPAIMKTATFKKLIKEGDTFIVKVTEKNKVEIELA